MKNEETVFNNRIQSNEIEDKRNNVAPWKYVTLGGVAGILMGAGSLYAGQKVVKEFVSESEEDVNDESNTQVTASEIRVANVGQDLSFGQAFAAARAEVGPGGVFYWHGGIYNTFTAEEWSAMSVEQKNEFAQHVQPEYHPHDLSTPTDANTQVIVVHHVYHNEDIQSSSNNTEGVEVAGHQADSNVTQDGDVHIVGYAKVQGHVAVGVDLDNDGQADVAIIDVDDNQIVSDPDIVVDRDGNMATMGEIVGSNASNINAADNNSDIPEDSYDGSDYPAYDV
jgi:hypothetical protein